MKIKSSRLDKRAANEWTNIPLPLPFLELLSELTKIFLDTLAPHLAGSLASAGIGRSAGTEGC